MYAQSSSVGEQQDGVEIPLDDERELRRVPWNRYASQVSSECFNLSRLRAR
jgi:hypothetical protein